MPSEITLWKCDVCRHTYDTEKQAQHCENVCDSPEYKEWLETLTDIERASLKA